MITKIINGKIILSDKVLENSFLYYEDGTITGITDKQLPFDKVIDAGNNYISPGFIDTHVHGGGGYDFSDGGTDAIINATEAHLKHGTTSILPTTLACSYKTLTEILEDIEKIKKSGLSRCRIQGVHLEGPYFSPNQCGAQNPEYIKAPDKAEYMSIINRFSSMIKRWSFAPELDGSLEFCKALKENSICGSIGHSDATYEDVKKVYDSGCKTFTHLYSGMSTITRKKGFRILGVIECAYLFPDITAEIIADGCHLPPELLMLIVKNIGVDNICLITDAMRAAGSDVKESYLGRKGEETPCIIENGVACTCDRSGFAGSIATADRLVRTMVQKANVSICDAVKMITINPAKAIGVKNIGMLKEGYVADIVIFDSNINIKKVIVDGNEIY